MFCDKKTGQMYFIKPEPQFDREGDLWEKFEEFHAAHPEVYEYFVKMIFEEIAKGETLSSISFLKETGRWREKYKINNNHSAYYSRIFIEQHPEYKEFFRLRRLKREKHNERRNG